MYARWGGAVYAGSGGGVYAGAGVYAGSCVTGGFVFGVAGVRPIDVDVGIVVGTESTWASQKTWSSSSSACRGRRRRCRGRRRCSVLVAVVVVDVVVGVVTVVIGTIGGGNRFDGGRMMIGGIGTTGTPAPAPARAGACGESAQ